MKHTFVHQISSLHAWLVETDIDGKKTLLDNHIEQLQQHILTLEEMKILEFDNEDRHQYQPIIDTLAEILFRLKTIRNEFNEYQNKD